MFQENSILMIYFKDGASQYRGFFCVVYDYVEKQILAGVTEIKKENWEEACISQR